MTERGRRLIHRTLVAACAVALLPVAVRLPEMRAEMRADRQAALLYQSGSRYFADGQYDEAAHSFRQGITLAPNAAELYGGLAEAEFRRGQIDAAVAVYRRLLEIYPYTYTASVYREVGLLELRAGRSGEARTDLESAVSLDPGDWRAYHFLGHALRRTGDIRGARAAWQRVTMLNPAFTPAREQLRNLDGSHL